MSNLVVAEYVSGGTVSAENLNSFVKNASPTKDFINSLNEVDSADVQDLRILVSTGSLANSVSAKASALSFINLYQNSLSTSQATSGDTLQAANLALGYSTGISGISNIAIGPQASQNVSGEANVVVGSRAGQNGSSGRQNVAIGVDALRNFASGIKNVAIGFMSLSSSSSSNCVAVGDSAAKGVTGERNVAVGASALGGTSSGTDNIAIGSSALSSSSLALGQRNLAAGTDSLKGLRGHGDNVALGHGTISSGTDVQHSVAVGSYAGEGSAGSDNVFIGYNSGKEVSNNSNSVVVGASASGKFNNCTVVGAGAVATKANQTVIGSANGSTIKFNGVPSSPDGLISGELYNDGGTLKIK